MLRRALITVVVVLGCWVVALVVLDFVLGSRQQRGTCNRLAEALQATATIQSSDLALIGGRWQFAGLAVRKDDAVGHLAIDVADVRCELPPLGWALLDRDCRELAVRGATLEASSNALFRLHHPRRRPIHAERVVIDDATITFLPSAFAANLGRVEIHIDHARSGPTTLRTPMSWLFAVHELKAQLALPAGVTVDLTYMEGKLAVTSTLLGAPVEIPLELPDPGQARDGHEENLLLVRLATQVAERVVAQRATDWLRSKLQPR